MVKSASSSFIAFAGNPQDLKNTIDAAAKEANSQGQKEFTAWPQMDIFGRYIPDEVRTNIEDADIFFADLTVRNLNVYYELGFAIGLGKPINPVVNNSFEDVGKRIQNEALLDNIGYIAYENSHELAKILLQPTDNVLIDLYGKDVNPSQPLFLLDTLRKTDFRNAIVSSIKKSKAHYRSYDPSENPRISLTKLVQELTASSGIVLPYLNSHIDDSETHNLRVAVCVGIADGLGRNAVIVRERHSESESPADFRDGIKLVQDPKDIDELILAFSGEASIASQSILPRQENQTHTKLQKLSFGASAAENEFRELKNYFVETSEYLRAARGEARIITGRKGSGKSAIFFSIRNALRDEKQKIVVDLKPESHQLSSFREHLVSTGNAGILDHTISAFWHFLILSEILLTIYRKIEFRSKYDSNAFSELLEIEKALEDLSVLEPGDFTTRLVRLSQKIIDKIDDLAREGKSVSVENITNIIFQQNISKTRSLIVKHAGKTEEIAFLFDNIDKGWPASGVDDDDVKIIRLLLETLQKVRREITQKDINFFSIVFLRRDIFDQLVNQTPDRQKYADLPIDWTDRTKLRQVIYLRMLSSLGAESVPFEKIWQEYFTEKVEDSSSFDYFVDHCMMRPRFLIDIVDSAVANAINRGHTIVEEDDCIDAVHSYSNNLIDDFGYEIRDVSGINEEFLYAFIGTDRSGTSSYYVDKLLQSGLTTDDAETAFQLMLWYGLLGVVDRNNRIKFIHDYDYNYKRLNAEMKVDPKNQVYVLNDGLFVGLTS